MFARFAGLRQQPARGVWLAAMIAAALAVIGLAVAVPQAHRAAAADAGGVASVTPTAFIDKDPQVTDLSLSVSLAATPANVGYQVDDSGLTNTVLAGSSPATTTIPVSQLDECGPHRVTVTIDYLGVNPPPAQTQTITGITRLCPTFTVSPPKVKGTDPVSITLQNWNSDGRFDSGFDSFGSYPDSAAYKKKLSVNGVKVDDEFGYKVTPTVKTPSLKDGDNTITLTQDSPFGTLTATATLNSWDSTWSVGPQGVVATPTAPITLTVRDSALHCGGTTAKVYLDDKTAVKASITAPPGNDRFALPPATFSDDGYFQSAGSGEHFIRVEIQDVPICGPIHFSGLDPTPTPDPSDPGGPGPGGGFGGAGPPPPPTIVRIPFTVLDPWVGADYSGLDQSALPFTQTVSVPGFDPDTDVYNNRDLQPKTIFVDDTQVGTTMADVWKGPVSPPCGDSVLKVTQPTSFGVVTAQTPLHVFCPQVQLSPAVIAKAAQPATLELSGDGFHRSNGNIGLTRPYVITIDGTQVGQGDMDDAGAFTNSFAASGLACGSHDVTVTELPSQGGASLARPTAAAGDPVPPDPNGPMTATAPLTVNCPTAGQAHGSSGQPGGSTSTPPAPTLAVNPQGVIAGMRTFVTGTGFTPGHKITLTWALSNGEKEAACPGTTVTVLPNRTIAAMCLIPQHDTIGRRQLIASDGTRSARADALIINSSMQPSSRNSRLVIRR